MPLASRGLSVALGLALCLTWSTSYFCRDHLLVSSSVFRKAQGLSKADFSTILSTGYVGYACGKVCFGFVVERWGGVCGLLITVVGSFLFSLCFVAARAFGRTFLFAGAFFLLRVSQSAGWLSMVHIVKSSLPRSLHGRMMSFLALSFLVGDALVRFLQGAWLARGMRSWEQLFVVSAFCTLGFGLLGLLGANAALRRLRALKQTAEGAECAAEGEGEEDPPLGRTRAPPGSCWAPLWPLVRSPRFWLLCAMSFQVDLIRETFSVFSVPFLETLEAPTSSPASDTETGAHAGSAAILSALPSLMGVPSVLAVGFLVDWLTGAGARRRVLCLWTLVLVLGTAILLQLTQEREGQGDGLRSPALLQADVLRAAAAFGIAGFGLSGAYSLKIGVLTLEFKTSAAACGLLDAAGYLGAFCGMSVLGQHNGGGATARWTLSDFRVLFTMDLLMAVALLVGSSIYSLPCCLSGDGQDMDLVATDSGEPKAGGKSAPERTVIGREVQDAPE